MKLLQQIPHEYRDDDASELLEEAIDLQDEATWLIEDIRESLKKRKLEGIDSNLTRLLELKPGNKMARELHESLNTYSGGRKFNFDDLGKLIPSSSGFDAFGGVKVAAIVGGVAFFLMLGAITFYLKSGGRTVEVTIDDPTAKVFIDGNHIEIDGEAGKVTLDVGEHEVTVEKDGNVFSGWDKYKFTVQKDKKNLLTIRLLDKPIDVVGGSTTNLTPSEILISPDYEWSKPENLGPVVNSSNNDMGAELSADGLSLYFHSSRPRGEKEKQAADLWMSTRKSLNDPFTKPVNLGETLHSDRQEMSPTLSGDGLTMLYCTDIETPGFEDIWMSTRSSVQKPFGTPVSLGSNVNSSVRDYGPTLSTDGLTMLFSSYRPGGYGYSDIWRSRRASTSKPFGKPENLGPIVNDKYGAGNPALSADGLILMFASYRNRKHGIWMSLRTSADAPFGKAVKLELNLNLNDEGVEFPYISPDGRTLFYSSTRLGAQGGKGDWDIWMSRRVKKPTASTGSPINPIPPGTWKPGSNENVIPGYVARPAKFAGLKRWQVTDRAPASRVGCVAYSPDRKEIACGCGLIRIYEASTFKLLRVLTGHTDSIYFLVYRPDGQQIASISADKTLRLWSVDGTPGPVLKGSFGKVVYRPDSQQLASGGKEGVIRLWSVDGTPGPVLKWHSGTVTSIAYRSDGLQLVSGGSDKTVRLWSVDGTPGPIMQGHTDMVRSVAYRPDGKQIASASNDRTVRLWSEDGTPGPILNGHTSRVYSVVYRPDSKQIASASGDRTVRLWSVDGTSEAVLEGHSSEVHSVAYRPDGKQIVSGGGDKMIRIQSVDGISSSVLKDHTGMIYSVAYHPSGQQFASGSLDGTIRLWDGQTGEPQMTIVPLSDDRAATFNAAGELLHGQPADYDDLLVYIIEPTTGPQQVLTPSEFQKRYAAGLGE